MSEAKKFDFGGWATRNDVLCTDGTTIKQGAFKHCDGAKVPLIWGHDHSRPDKVLGYAILEDRPEGTYSYGYFNNSDESKNAKEAVMHGDIDSLSIYANKVQYGGATGRDVIHGIIREVSLVFVGADPTARIDVVLEHDEELGEGAIISFGEKLEFAHSEDASVEESVEVKEDNMSQIEEVKETVEDVKEAVEDKVEDVVETVEENFDVLKGAAEEVHEEVEEKVEEVKAVVEDVPATKICPLCGVEVDADAAVCPICGYEFE